MDAEDGAVGGDHLLVERTTFAHQPEGVEVVLMHAASLAASRVRLIAGNSREQSRRSKHGGIKGRRGR